MRFISFFYDFAAGRKLSSTYRCGLIAHSQPAVIFQAGAKRDANEKYKEEKAYGLESYGGSS